ncbi:FAD-dependent oxidoreductase [Rhodococcus sp. BP-349]|uniref:NAD(P)/FAD-dependent oxidoreductase n=1 Tax=unclassified Rhodococcus (in: high G+C Gram-positive bacteria) TaxID=192944 RepID=UPI001C9AA693|nr:MULTISPECIES: FAD/NAD(P)-binding oxidoreductase [unclassified Rhodococcus (in: high G+C Gram-positive bacteria)]MBY6538031.1 FAD-dependent oxidoreductase [Rhodococcus sp. BP-363]MBY6542368.1 FAD-dependent oxidoreductase [Rhodococcus sp. BP-369]MBY6561598.1 FAD-dependent oxidoreductase [Rhodococcus sp. BP-370]MBY6575890.1 FAD-dependent oxidoreductase [Rhodococcus sp. BP-364]MBY6585191.1 FAD-dependent oxidoreductase [Rhodococcus sp. BP-358]
MSGAERRVVIVGDSIAGCTAARELRALGHDGPITMIGRDPDGCYARPPLSKRVLAEGVGASDAWDLSDLNLTSVTAEATGVDVERRTIALSDGADVPYDALIVATGADARRLAAPEQNGEIVVRSLADARLLRNRLDTATSAIVVGAGFLGMEVVSACASRDIAVTVVDVDPPLHRILGPFLSDAIAARAAARAVEVRRVDRPVDLLGDPVGGVRIDDDESTADLVVTCAGEVPGTRWLDGTGIGDGGGVDIDERCATAVPGVYAAGDVARTVGEDGLRRRTPFWSNAIAQGRVAAASALDVPARCAPTDDYFWTEVLGLSIKVVGPLPLVGAPTVLEGSVEDGSALLEWTHESGRRTVVAYGMKKAVGLLRRMAA